MAAESMRWELFLTALGLALVLEGIPYFLFPRGVKQMSALLADLGPSWLRILGLISMLMGLLVIRLGRT